MDILMMLIFPIHEYDIYFHLFVCSFISFFSVVQFSEYRSFTSLVRFLPRYFIFLVAVANGTFFLISVSYISLLVYKNAFHFLTLLTLYPSVFPKSLIRQSSFLVDSIGFSMYTIMSSANNDSFASSFPIWMPFVSFSCLIAVARTSNTMLNRSGESEHPCLFPDLNWIALCFYTLSMMLAVGLSYMAFIMLGMLYLFPLC